MIVGASLIVGTCNLSTHEVEADGLSIVRGQPGLYSYYKANQSYKNLPQVSQNEEILNK